MRTALIFALMLLPYLAMVGCSSTDQQGSLIVSAAFRYALVRYIDEADDPEQRAAEIVEGSEALLQLLDEGDIVAIPVVEQYVRERMGYDTKPFEERLLIDSLVEAVHVSLRDAAEGADIDPETKVRLLRIISSARDTAHLYVLNVD